ncbi:MAG: Asp-tRNA(Asn)/Glu-tRNA(Gln) amidotransferase subunit GatC [Candidatus Aenigmarchaeota archaeon]|nr:Asp-tRNA(Asn)/Glu-tRNA(Gln) amidotransferase subunit GatC [Candidatus Aenigmarchaeota archaeon]
MGEVDVRAVAKIARITLTDEEAEAFARDIDEIKKIFDEIDRIEVSEEPAFQPIEVKNRTREDVAKKGFSIEEAFSNTGHREENYFRGPKV